MVVVGEWCQRSWFMIPTIMVSPQIDHHFCAAATIEFAFITSIISMINHHCSRHSSTLFATHNVTVDDDWVYLWKYQCHQTMACCWPVSTSNQPVLQFTSNYWPTTVWQPLTIIHQPLSNNNHKSTIINQLFWTNHGLWWYHGCQPTTMNQSSTNLQLVVVSLLLLVIILKKT